MPKKPMRHPVSQGFASVAGASTGTTLLWLVSALPARSSWKPFLTYAAPSLAVATSWISYQLKIMADMYVTAWRMRIADLRIKTQLEEASDILQRIEGDPRSSEKLKRDAREKFEALRLYQMKLRGQRIESIGEKM